MENRTQYVSQGVSIMGFSLNKGVWAPDIIYYNNLYSLYCSFAAAFRASACEIGLMTSPTLNPSSPNYKWTDRGQDIYAS
jgi:hypothetical protein